MSNSIINNPGIKLNSFQASEKRGDNTEIEFDEFFLTDFNLLIGDNAQGKTRLLNILGFLSKEFSGKPRVIGTNFNAKMKFQVIEQDSIKDIAYEINIEPEGGKNIFHESIVKDGSLIYSSKEKFLYNETKKVKIDNYFVPKNIPAIVSITEPDFVTINLLREFFMRIIYVTSLKKREVTVDVDAIIPNEGGTNLNCVLKNWSKQYPEIFNEVMNEFCECFDFIDKINFAKHVFQAMHMELLSMNENNLNYPILQFSWSDGLSRILYLILSTKVPFSINKTIKPPSLILIDEVENGIDFKRLKHIIRYLQDYSDDSQIIITSHSPLVCELVHPKSWMVVKREGSKLRVLSPQKIEKDLIEQLELFKNEHWEFYAKHISNSEEYKVE